MPRYADSAKEQVRDAVDFVDLVGKRVDLRKSGQTRYEGLCPFHDERSPSFGINPTEKVFYCFGCQKGGDVFTFVQETEGLDFVASLEFLADRYGVTLEVVEEDPQAVEKRKRSERLLELLDRTATFYARFLWESPEAERARAYLAERGLGEEVLRTYRVGFSPSRFDVVLNASRRAGFTNREIYDAGVAGRTQGGQLIDRFRGRVMFPLADRRGRVMGFGARKLAEDDFGPKYLNSGDSDVFHKGRHVYAADLARGHATKAGSVILAEGYTDVIALHQAGIRNVVGLMGTALTPEQVVELSRMAPKVDLALDADNAGQKAMLRAAQVAAGSKVELRVVPLSAGEDPADVVARAGAEAMRELVANSVPFVRFQVLRELDLAPLDDAEAKDRVIEALKPIFATLGPSAMREELIGVVADRTDLAPSLVAGWLAGPTRRASPPSEPRRGRPGERPVGAPSPPPSPAASGPRSPLAREERRFLAACAAVPGRGAEALAGDLDALFLTPLNRQTAEHLRDHLHAPTEGLQDGDPRAPLLTEIAVRASQFPTELSAFGLEQCKLRLARVEHDLAHPAGDGSTAALAQQRIVLKAEVDRLMEQVVEEQGER